MLWSLKKAPMLRQADLEPNAMGLSSCVTAMGRGRQWALALELLRADHPDTMSCNSAIVACGGQWWRIFELLCRTGKIWWFFFGRDRNGEDDATCFSIAWYHGETLTWLCIDLVNQFWRQLWENGDKIIAMLLFFLSLPTWPKRWTLLLGHVHESQVGCLVQFHLNQTRGS